MRGEQVSGEYLGRGAAVNADGWLATNDGGWLDADGYLFVEGRLDDVIVRGGENLSPGEIEDVLAQHPAVAEAAVIGIPSDEWGEAVAAVVVVRNGHDADPGDDRATIEGELRVWVSERLRSTRHPNGSSSAPNSPTATPASCSVECSRPN